jgi:hypothetical protein
MDQKAIRRETKVIKRQAIPARSAPIQTPAQRLEKMQRATQALANRMKIELEEMRKTG